MQMYETYLIRLNARQMRNLIEYEIWSGLDGKPCIQDAEAGWGRKPSLKDKSPTIRTSYHDLGAVLLFLGAVFFVEDNTLYKC